MSLRRGSIRRGLRTLERPTAIAFMSHVIVALLASLVAGLFLAPQIISTAAMTVAIVALATALSKSSQATRDSAGPAAYRAVRDEVLLADGHAVGDQLACASPAPANLDDTESAQALMADVLAVARSAHGLVDVSRTGSSPIDTQPRRPKRRWMRIDTAARRSGLTVEAIEALAADGRTPHRLGRAGTMMVDYGKIDALIGGQPDIPAPVRAAITDAIEMGRAHMDVTAIAILPSRKPAGVIGRLVLSDMTGATIAMARDLEPSVQARHDLLAIAFAAATIKSRPPGVGERPMFVRLAISSLLSHEFQDELATLCEDEPELAAQLVLRLPPEAFGPVGISAAIGVLAAHGIRFAVDCPDTLMLNELIALLGRQSDCSFVMAPTAKFIGAPDAAAAFTRIGIRPIAVDVTAEREVVELIDLGLEWASGPLLASSKPAPIHFAAPQAA